MRRLLYGVGASIHGVRSYAVRTTLLITTLCCGLLSGASVQAQTSATAEGVRASVQRQFAAKRLVMLYRKETDAAPNRLDPMIQATTQALDQEFLNHQYQITEPTADVLKAMDQGASVIVQFAPDAGMSMIYSVYGNLRPMPGTAIAIAEIRIDARVYVGASLLAAEQGRGQMQTRTDAGLGEYGQRRAYELAAQSAAQDLANHVDRRLKQLTPEQVASMTAEDAASVPFAMVPPVASAAVPGEPAGGSTPAASVADAASTQAPAPVQSAPAGKHWLVSFGVQDFSHVIGVSGAGTHKNDLDGTHFDVLAVQKAFRQYGFEVAPQNNLFDSTATTAAVRNVLAQMAHTAGSEDVVVFYLSSHGMIGNFRKQGDTLPVFYDSNLTMTDGALDFGELVSLFTQIPARQLVMVLDTCHSGGATQNYTTVTISSRGIELARTSGSPDVGRLFRSLKSGGADIAIMSAARADEYAKDLGAQAGGLFTNNLLKALTATQGQATLEKVYSGYVLQSVRDYCKKLIAAGTECEQNPVLGYGGRGNLIRVSAVDSKAARARASQ